MTRDSSVGLSELLNVEGAEAHSTLQLTLRGASQPEIKLHWATSELVIDGATYEARLKEVGAMRLSLDRGDDFIEVRLQDAGELLGADPAAALDALRGARARYGRYWRDPNGGKTNHKT